MKLNLPTPSPQDTIAQLSIASTMGGAGLVAALAAEVFSPSHFVLGAVGEVGVAVTTASVLFIADRLRRTHKWAQSRLEEQLDADRTARRDPLTGLANRLAFRQQIEALAAGATDPVVVMFADLDRFKEVNDSLGHDAGDALLVEVGQRFKSVLGREDLVARLGGDEFAAVLVGHDAAMRAEAMAEAVIEAVSQPVTVAGNAVYVGVSIGIAGGDEKLTSEELLRRADVAMYRAKGGGSGSFRRYTADMDEALIYKRLIRNDLETAMKHGDLRLELQPVFDARTSKIVSAEALMRWRHPTRGELSPAKFIPVAEESGLIAELGDWVIDRALACCKELTASAARHAGGPKVPIAVNVSPVQFRQHGFAKSVADRLLRANVSPSLLRIEITEGVLIEHTDAASRTLRQLREIGVRVVLDDFGTGYSSLSYLQSFDFDAVKIDRAFVRDLGARRQSTQLTRAIIDLGHGLEIEVVAEGVENARQASMLQLMGCDHLQGYFLGVPADLETLRTRIAAEAAKTYLPDDAPRAVGGAWSTSL